MNVTITVKDWSDGFDLPAVEFIEELTGLLATVPEEYRAAAVLEFDRYGSDYDSSRGELTLRYTRPESDDERRAREQYAQRRATEQEARERAEYARLKAKFELSR